MKVYVSQEYAPDSETPYFLAVYKDKEEAVEKMKTILLAKEYSFTRGSSRFVDIIDIQNSVLFWRKEGILNFPIAKIEETEII